MADIDPTTLPHSRAEALQAGLPHYRSGRKCPKGHAGRRRTINGSCMECNSIGAMDRYARGYRPDAEGRRLVLQKWNGSSKAYAAKLKWADKDPKNAWACSVTGAARQRAMTGNLPFDLDKDYVASIASDVCPALGVRLDYTRGIRRKRIHPDSPSLDRIKPELGYVRGNIAVICMRANTIKHNATAAEIRRVADWLETALG